MHSNSVITFAFLVVVTTALTAACGGKGNGPAVNPPGPAPAPSQPPVVAESGIDLASLKGTWTTTAAVEEFRKTGKLDAFCRDNSSANPVEDNACILDDKGGLFPYSPKSWEGKSESAQLGELNHQGRLSFREIPEWPTDKSLYAEVKISAEAMTWTYKRDGQTGDEPAPASFTRVPPDELRKLVKAFDACKRPNSN